MPVLVWVAIGAVGALLVSDKLSDILGGVPNPVSVTGAAVWGLAGFGAWQVVKRLS